jgi:perosamine synthetase
LGQLERSKELVNQRIEVANLFKKTVKEFHFLKPQVEPEGYKNSWWSFTMVLDTNYPEKDWIRFRSMFLKNGGDPYYAAWKLSYFEPLFQNMFYTKQKYTKGLCVNAEYLQPRLIQLKTNYWNMDEVIKQVEILHKTCKNF